MYWRRLKVLVIILAFLMASVAAQNAQEQKGVLEPENANEARLNRLQPPDKVMDAIGVTPGMVMAEIGAGRGRYVVQFAVRVGEEGKVYAEDIDAAALEYLEKRCERWGLKNVETILGDVTDPKLPDGTLDLIFVISAYHHFEDPVALLRNARSALKPDGKLAIGEWFPTDERPGGTSPEKMEAQMNAAGYKLERLETFLKANRLNIYIFRIDDKR
ncbi:MAG: methyltransferase domain-containing protein [candidate division Zixibacteria bacterium]|nr:methyltransferase domain-containing protein [candidate division Zixibacteria bacterium]